MNPLISEHMPFFIKREMEKIAEQVQPLMKRNSRYILFAFPLMLVGGINLIIMAFQGNWSEDMLPIAVTYALIASIGMALYKEAKHVNKKIHQIGKEHMIERIKTSHVVADDKKKAYINMVKEHSKMSLQIFFNFLTEENKEKQDTFS
ncbi:MULTISPECIES: DUF5392 family protein [Paraliobacillus]|uniref:DUF5392 family protein n=1 Tax=Paraliobacillus TaxID=200903 RepID=UPI000DD3745E|nr:MULTISPECIES: DUF5392 family protein [Paraliobacillus]